MKTLTRQQPHRTKLLRAVSPNRQMPPQRIRSGTRRPRKKTMLAGASCSKWEPREPPQPPSSNSLITNVEVNSKRVPSRSSTDEEAAEVSSNAQTAHIISETSFKTIYESQIKRVKCRHRTDAHSHNKQSISH